jgi:hypothetical protein
MATAMGQSDVQFVPARSDDPFLVPQFRMLIVPHLVVDVPTALVLDENFANSSNSTNVAQ